MIYFRFLVAENFSIVRKHSQDKFEIMLLFI